MTDALIFDAVRTPRGRGKADGGLHEVTPVRLAAGVLDALRQRNDLDTALVDDVPDGGTELEPAWTCDACGYYEAVSQPFNW